MGIGLKNGQVIVVILCIGELLTIGLLTFSHGFLLTRQVVDKNSTCQDFQVRKSLLKSHNSENEGGTAGQNSECWMAPTFKRAIILLIDALRYDFTTYNAAEDPKDAKPFTNKMPIFDKIVQSKPSQARLLPFIADSPTTTMQRLKGLTTGSLPTFIDASHNFASEEITEDNIVDQLVGCGKKVTILGDDTWDGLFPGRFNRSFLYPSFNVMDLHTVDNGVISHLNEEIARDEWDVIIAHFLGVDHCGHRYGPNHPEMAAKLLQMNNIVKNVVEKIQNDTLLLVFGDHGMTRTGDHGGDSQDETTAALFLFSPSLNIPLSGHQQSPSYPVAQVDLVPTLALALGLPVPYSNLGKVIDDVLVTVSQSAEETALRQMQGLDLNVRQVDRYLKEYKNLGNEFPEDLWQKLEVLHKNLSQGMDELPFTRQKQLYTEYLTLSKMMCEEIWAKFNVSEMIIGLLVMACMVLLLIGIIIQNLMIDEKTNIVNGLFILTAIVNSLYVLSPYISIVFLGCVACVMVIIFMWYYRFNFDNFFMKWDFSEVIPLVIVFFGCIGSVSNSYVVVENHVVAFLLLSLVTVQAFSSFVKQHKKKSLSALPGKLVKWASNYSGLLCVSALLVVLVCVRVGAWFWKCREEQSWCVPSQIHTSMAGLPQSLRNWRYFSSLLSLILLTWLPRRWLMMCGNMNGSKLGVVLVKNVPVICSVLVASHWALQAVPALQNSPLKEYVVMPPLLSYALVIILTVAIFVAPLLIFEVPPSKTDIGPVTDNPYTCIPQLYHTLKAKYGTNNEKKQSIPIVYGLATAISAPLISALTGVLTVVVLLAGDGVSTSVLTLVAAAAACLLVQGATSWMNAENLENVMKPTWSSVCVWFMLSLHGFYSTGHHPTFPSLHWSAAFVGFEGDWSGSNFIPAVLVGFNTFSAQILYGLSLPLLVLGPLALGVVFPKLRNNRLENEDTRQGEFLFVEDSKRATESLLFVSGAYMILHAGKVFLSAVSAFILRRHLMVWKIFAPHFIFDAVGFIVTCCCVPIGVLYTLRVINTLDAFSDYLRHKYS